MINPKNLTNVISHRGLEPSKTNFFSESSKEAFLSQLERNFGLEMDFNLTEDNQIVLWHNTQAMRTKTAEEIRKLSLKNGKYCFLQDISNELTNSSSCYHALHVKHAFQNKQDLDFLSLFLNEHQALLSKLIIFDLKPKTADYLKNKFTNLQLAASVAHPFDIERFSDAVGQTLISHDELEKLGKLYNWAWLDEWDLKANNGGTKKFYTPEVFMRLRQQEYMIAVISPELHGTSPSLLGGESHESSRTKSVLFSRIGEILTLNPDVICTDYPEEVKKMI